MSESTVLYEQENNIVTITYNRPDNLNTINGQMREELNQAWTRFLEDETAWVAIVTGNGSVFCAGADLKDGILTVNYHREVPESEKPKTIKIKSN